MQYKIQTHTTDTNCTNILSMNNAILKAKNSRRKKAYKQDVFDSGRYFFYYNFDQIFLFGIVESLILIIS